jgi:hypothetical protein
MADFYVHYNTLIWLLSSVFYWYNHLILGKNTRYLLPVPELPEPEVPDPKFW